MSSEQAKNVWVLIEQREGLLRDGCLELAGEGRRVADRLGGSLTAVLSGVVPEDQASLLAQCGADRILFIEQPNVPSVETGALILSRSIKEQSPEVVLAVDTIDGTDLLSRTAALLGTSLASSCDKTSVGPDRTLQLSKPIYGGRAAATIVPASSRPQFATICLDALTPAVQDKKRKATIERLNLPLPTEKPRVRSKGLIKGDPRTVDLTDADIIVDAGRGLGSPQGFKLVEELAGVIGGSVGASRMVVDAGWTTSERQIGLTGKTVKPRLIIACGISGASQHVIAMKDSNTIVAINTDRNAPVFKIADVSVVGDVLKVLPALTEHLRKVLGKKPSAGEVLGVLRDSGAAQ